MHERDQAIERALGRVAAAIVADPSRDAQSKRRAVRDAMKILDGTDPKPSVEDMLFGDPESGLDPITQRCGPRQVGSGSGRC